MSSKKQPPPMRANSPSSGLANAGGPPECRATTTLKKTCAATNRIPASAHAHSGTILISAVSPVCVSFLTCISCSALLLPLSRLLAIACEVRAASQQQHTYHQRGRDEEKHETGLPNQGRDSGPFSHPGKEPPQEGDGERGRKTHSQTGHPDQPQAFPRLAKPAGVQTPKHLPSLHQG